MRLTADYSYNAGTTMATTPHKELLADLKHRSPLNVFSQHGIEPKLVKLWIIDELHPYFDNRDNLERFAIDALSTEAIRLQSIKHDAWAIQVFAFVLATYKRSRMSSHIECYRIFGDWHERIFRGMSAHWSLYRLKHNLDSLSAVDRAFEAFRALGSVLEGQLQPYMREFLAHIRIVRGRQYEHASIEQLDFGNVVQELVDTSKFPQAFSLSSHGISISQWRNIAQHHGFTVEGVRVRATYGKAANRKTVMLEVQEVIKVLQRASLLLATFETARAVFSIDHCSEFTDAIPEVELREEARIVQLSTAFSTQGFQLTDVRITEEETIVEVCDVLGGVTTHRAAHASQLTFAVWVHLGDRDVRMSFLSSDNSQWVFVARADVCRAISEEREPLEHLAREVVIERK